FSNSGPDCFDHFAACTRPHRDDVHGTFVDIEVPGPAVGQGHQNRLDRLGGRENLIDQHSPFGRAEPEFSNNGSGNWHARWRNRGDLVHLRASCISVYSSKVIGVRAAYGQIAEIETASPSISATMLPRKSRQRAHGTHSRFSPSASPRRSLIL